MVTTNTIEVEKHVLHWLEEIVIGLNLCPFAAKPHKKKQIKIVVLPTTSLNSLLENIEKACEDLEETSVEVLETSLIVCPNLLDDFYDYNDFLHNVDKLIGDRSWRGVFQVASFHPCYQFDGTRYTDAENLTNRAPYPIFHLIREESMEKVLAHYKDPEGIPANNIRLMNNMSEADKKRLFYYLF